MPAVSVIIPVHNRPQLLQTALESILAQSFTDYEILVVDDGSTVELLGAVPALNHPAVRYLRQPNAGAGAARNSGLAAAGGEFMSFLDSDDVMLPDNLRLLHQCLADQPAAAVAHGWATIVDHEGREAQRTRPILAGWAGEHYLIRNATPVGTLLLRRECFEAGYRFDETLPLFEDWDLWLRLAFHYRYAYVRALVARIVLQPVQRSTSRPAPAAAQVLEGIYGKLLNDPAAAPTVRRRWGSLMANARVMAGHHYRLYDMDMVAARREFVNALLLAPTFWPAYAGLAEATLGPAAVAHLRALRSRLFGLRQSAGTTTGGRP